MKQVLSTIVLSFLYFQSFGQTELFSILNIGQRTTDDNIVFKMTGNENVHILNRSGSVIQTTEALNEPDSIFLKFSVSNPSSDAKLFIEVSKDNAIWSVGQTVDLKALSLSKSQKEKTVSRFSMNIPPSRLFVRMSTKDMAEGDTIRIYEYKIYRMEEKEKNFYQNKTASNKEIEDLVRLNFDSKDTAFLNSNSRKFKDKYVETIDAAIILLENNSKLIDFTNVIQVINSRNEMVNPLKYEAFKGFINELRNDADSLDKIILDHLNSAVEAQIQKTPSRISQVIGAGYKIANLMTGGKLENIFTNIKQIFARTYSQGTIFLKELQDPLSSIVSLKKGAKDKLVVTQEAVDNAKTKSHQQIGKLIFLDSLTAYLNNEIASLDQSIQLIVDAENDLKNYKRNMEQFLSTLLAPLNIKITQADIANLQKSDPAYLKFMMDSISNHFKSIINITQTRSRLPEARISLEAIVDNFKSYSELENEYFTNANYIYSIISGIVDYFNNLNPFPSTPSFKPYYDEWKKKAAAVKPMADQLPANFNTNYSISIKNQLDKLRKRY